MVGGEARIVDTSPTRTDIVQHSDRAVINWQRFDIGVGEHTNFDQPSASSIALNRVVGNDPSDILGRLTANGQVWLVNPNGVFFGRDATIDVAGLLATTADIGTEDFMAGRYIFDGPASVDAAVVNEGTVTVREAGLAAFVAPRVANRGAIHARLGRVSLAAGDAFTIDLYGDRLVNLVVAPEAAARIAGPEDATVQPALSNEGAVFADGGRVVLTAADARAVVDSLIDMSGVVRARAVAEAEGEIVLLGSAPGLVRVSGSLDASGNDRGEAGGQVQVLGDKVALMNGAVIDSSGRSGGGTVLVGGDYKGGARDPRTISEFDIEVQNEPVRRAAFAYVAPSATVKADAVETGDGGQIVVWADDTTRSHGVLSARGGQRGGGDGGFVETSGKRHLDVRGTPDVTATNGRNGTWLLDPRNVVIRDAASAGIDVTTPFEGDPDQSLFLAIGDDAIVDRNTIETALNAGTHVIINTGEGDQDGNITVVDPITKTAGPEATLQLEAFHNLNINAPITSTSGALNLSLFGVFGDLNINAPIDTNGGDFTLNDPVRFDIPLQPENLHFVNFFDTVRTGAGDVDIHATTFVNGSVAFYVHEAIVTTSGDVDITANFTITHAELPASAATPADIVSGGDVTITAATMGADLSGSSAGTLTMNFQSLSPDDIPDLGIGEQFGPIAPAAEGFDFFGLSDESGTQFGTIVMDTRKTSAANTLDVRVRSDNGDFIGWKHVGGVLHIAPADLDTMFDFIGVTNTPGIRNSVPGRQITLLANSFEIADDVVHAAGTLDIQATSQINGTVPSLAAFDFTGDGAVRLNGRRIFPSVDTDKSAVASVALAGSAADRARSVVFRVGDVLFSNGRGDAFSDALGSIISFTDRLGETARRWLPSREAALETGDFISGSDNLKSADVFVDAQLNYLQNRPEVNEAVLQTLDVYGVDEPITVDSVEFEKLMSKACDLAACEINSLVPAAQTQARHQVRNELIKQLDDSGLLISR